MWITSNGWLKTTKRIVEQNIRLSTSVEMSTSLHLYQWLRNWSKKYANQQYFRQTQPEHPYRPFSEDHMTRSWVRLSKCADNYFSVLVNVRIFPISKWHAHISCSYLLLWYEPDHFDLHHLENFLKLKQFTNFNHDLKNQGITLHFHRHFLYRNTRKYFVSKVKLETTRPFSF